MPLNLARVIVLRSVKTHLGGGDYAEVETAIAGSPFLARVYRVSQTTVSRDEAAGGTNTLDEMQRLSVMGADCPIRVNDIALLPRPGGRVLRAKVVRPRPYGDRCQFDLETGAEGDLPASASEPPPSMEGQHVDIAEQGFAEFADTVAPQNIAEQGFQEAVDTVISSAASGPATLGQPFANRTGKRLFLHMQSSDAAPGREGVSLSLTGAQLYVQHAAAIGADGFAIDLNSDDPNFTLTLKNYYLAVNQYNAATGWANGQTGTTNALGVGQFSLYVKFDFSNTALETSAAMLGILDQFLTDPANTTYANPKTGLVQPVFSCYVGGGSRSWASLLAIFGPVNAALKARGITPLFVYGGEVTNPDGSASDGSLASLTAWAKGCVAPFAQAVCEFPGGCPTGTGSGVFEKETLAQAVHAAGLLWQGAFNTEYSQMNNPNSRVLIDFYGMEGVDAQLRSAIDVQGVDLWDECTTGDDFDEASAILSVPPLWTPPLPAWVGLRHYDTPNWYKDQTGKQKALEYYFARLKTGQWPTLARDLVVGAYIAMTPQCLAAPTADPLGPLPYVLTENGYYPPLSQPFTVRVMSCLEASGLLRLTTTPIPPPATHTHIVADSDDSHYVYDPVNPFDDSAVGQTLQITGGDGWTIVNAVVSQIRDYNTQDGPQKIVYLAANPASPRITGGQGTLYAAGATLPPLPPSPLVVTAFVPAGQSFRRMAAQAGTVKLELLRQNAVVLTLTGEPIMATAPLANTNNTWIWGEK